jgi:hypothetical protein
MARRSINTNNAYYNNISNFFSDSLSIEVATLQKNVILPYINEEFTCYQIMHAYKEAECEFRLADEWYHDVKANFYMPMISPMVVDGDSTLMEHTAPDVSNFIATGEGEFVVSEYKEQNFIELIIPTHIVLAFRKEIPKGTKFIVNFSGGTAAYAAMSIIGIKEVPETGYVMKEYHPLTWSQCVAEAGGEEAVIEWLQERVEARIEEYEEAKEKVGEVLLDKVEYRADPLA